VSLTARAAAQQLRVAADNGGMSATIDDRLLEQWKVSRRHQDEARRFLARQKFSDPRGERRALEEIVGTIADLEQTLRERAARRSTRPTQTGPRSA
jgi:C4-dicarboxylate-specific signal transduction histidine kinase